MVACPVATSSVTFWRVAGPTPFNASSSFWEAELRLTVDAATTDVTKIAMIVSAVRMIPIAFFIVVLLIRLTEPSG